MVGLVEIAPSTSRKNIKMWEFVIPYIFHYVVSYDIMLIGSINFKLNMLVKKKLGKPQKLHCTPGFPMNDTMPLYIFTNLPLVLLVFQKRTLQYFHPKTQDITNNGAYSTIVLYDLAE